MAIPTEPVGSLPRPAKLQAAFIAYDNGNISFEELGAAQDAACKDSIERMEATGSPIVSDGDHYDGREIPDHDTRPEFEKPAVSWNPVISPGDLMIYRGDLFSDWRGDAFAAGLSSQAIVRVEFDGVSAREAARYDMGARIRSVAEGPDGAIWVLEDDEDESTGRLLKLTPKN